MEPVDGWWLGACSVPSRALLWTLAQRAGGWESLERCSRAELIELGVDPDRATRWVEMPEGRTVGCAITRTDPRYPARLARCEQAPPVLFVQGDPSCLGPPGVAIVGTRRCSGKGAAFARTLAADLARGGAVVISGLARGIDAAAHQGALVPDRGRTVAVLGHGLAHQAPRSNTRLRQSIVERGGLVVAGWPDRIPPDRWTFPARNRWVAAMSRAVVVVEGPRSSGALITARDALFLGVDVWVVPGHPGDPLSAGPLGLLQTQLSDDDEAFRALKLRAGQALESGDQGLPTAVRSALSHAIRPPRVGRVHLLADPTDFVQQMTGARDAQQDGWMAQLLAGASVEEVARAWQMPVLELRHELTRRELDGELVRLPGGRYAAAR